MLVSDRFPYYVKWHNPEISIFMKKPSIRTCRTLILHSKITKTTHRFFSIFLKKNLFPSLFFSLLIYLLPFRFLLLFLMCSYSIFPPYHHLLLHLSFLQYFPTLSLSLSLFFFPFFSFSFKLLSCRVIPSWSWKTLTELTEEARVFRFIRIIRNELTFQTQNSTQISDTMNPSSSLAVNILHPHCKDQLVNVI